ncbi:MAG: AAA family ATPase [Candidatus Omnitrophica bacterium]|nr:AAA family ATPase [Candidatus Omnitrophota bacterium]
MAIEKIKLKNFTVFEDINIDFCKGINIFIGENGAGKTHLLKVLYFFMHELGADYGSIVFGDLFGRVSCSTNIIRNLDDCNGIAEFSCTIDGNEESLRLDVSRNKKDLISRISVSDKRISPKNATNSNSIYIHFGPLRSWQKNESKPKSIFIPAKEMLSHSKSLLALDHERNIPFDKTLIDIVAKAELGESKSISQLSQKLLDCLSDIIDGEVIYENDTFYMIKKNGLRIEFSMEADGLCKFGLLWKLIRNSLIEKDTILFWDEPETNINPQLIPDLVEILLELQRNGVQIFLATHDCNLAKYFEVKQKKEDSIVYYNLFKTKNGVQYTKAVTYGDIVNNPIEEADEKLYEDILINFRRGNNR